MALLERLPLHLSIVLLALVLSGSVPITNTPNVTTMSPEEVKRICMKKIEQCKVPVTTCSDLDKKTNCMKQIQDCPLIDSIMDDLAGKAQQMQCAEGIVNIDGTKNATADILLCQQGVKQCDMKRKVTDDICSAEKEYRDCLKHIAECRREDRDELVPHLEESRRRGKAAGCKGETSLAKEKSEGKDTGGSCGMAASLPTVLVALTVALFCQGRLGGGGG